MKFTQSGKLNSHGRNHTGEKPFVCPDCDMKFKQSNELNRQHKIPTGENRLPVQIVTRNSHREANTCKPELSTGRMDPRIGSRHDFGGSGQHFRFLVFSLIISWYLYRYESSNTNTIHSD